MKNKSMLLALLVLLFSCKKEEKADETTARETDYLTGRFAVNEGNFNENNGSISYINISDELTNDLYLQQNGVEIGDVLQSFTVIGDKGFAVVNNSQKVEVIDLKSFKRTATLSGLTYPRYLADGNNGKAYLSNGNASGEIKVIDLANNSIESTIAVGNGPEKMLVHGGYLYVCNNGGVLTDNRVTVIDLSDHSIVTNVVVGDRPIDVIADAFGNVWVLCSGETLYDVNWSVVGHTNAMLYRISANSLSVTASEQIGINGDHPMNIEISPAGNIIYYENNGIFAFDLISGEFPGVEIVNDDRGSLNVDPNSGEIWSASVSDFSSPSVLNVYSTSGALIKSFNTGIGTNSVAFR